MVDGAGGPRGLRRYLRRDRDDLRRLCGTYLLAGGGFPLDRWASGGPIRQLADRDGARPEGTRRRGRVRPAPAERARMSLVSSRVNIRGRSPPSRIGSRACIAFVQANEKETVAHGDAIGTEVQRSLWGRQGAHRSAGLTGARDDHPPGRGCGQLAPGQQEAYDPPATRHGQRGCPGWSLLGFPVRADLLRPLPWSGDRGWDGSAHGFDGRRWDRR